VYPQVVTRFTWCAALLVAAGCEASPRAAHLPTAGAPAGHARYSPWVVELASDDLSIDGVSFKDVGLASVGPARHPGVYQEIASGLASALGEGAAPLQSSVRYSEAMSDPANHLSCMPRHVYVDLWESGDRQRIGYSLWSGCGEADRFAWREVERPTEGAIAALTRSIAGSLREAVRTGCFTRAC